MWAWCGTPSAWRGWTAGRRSWGNTSSRCTTAAEEVPAWFGEGVTYQIFPDRFRRSRIPDPAGMVGGRSVHTGWQEEPEYRPDRPGRGAQPGLLRRRPGGRAGEAGLPPGPGGGDPLLLPHLRGGGEPPLRHRRLREDRPHAGHRGGLLAPCAPTAHALGMRVVLDGVFNHQRLCQPLFQRRRLLSRAWGPSSPRTAPTTPGTTSQHWPDQYDSWWGIYSLPAVNESRSLLPRTISSAARTASSAAGCGPGRTAGGWTWPTSCPTTLSTASTPPPGQAKPEAVVIGEVWEDGSNKIAYGVRRRHILGGHCDGLMNYPFRNALLSFLLGGDAVRFRQAMETLRENYPPFALLLGHELPGHPRHPPHPHPAGHGGRRQGPRPRTGGPRFRMSPGQYAAGAKPG